MHVATTVLQLFKILSLSQSSSMNVPTFPLLGFDMIIIMGYLHCFLSSAISSVIFNFFMSSSTTLLQVVLAYLSSLLSQVCYSHPYVLLDQPISTLFYLICVKCSPHHISSHLLVILSYHLTLDMYLNILWSQLASSPSSLSINAQVLQHTAPNMNSKPSLFSLVECYGLLASSPSPSIYSKHRISYPFLSILPLLHISGGTTFYYHQLGFIYVYL